MELTTPRIRVTTRDMRSGIYELKIDGSIDASTFTIVLGAIGEIFSKGIYRIVVNLRGTRYVSSVGIGCFVSSLDTAMKHHGDMVFAGTPPEIQEIFHILGLSKILCFTNDEHQAVERLRRDSRYLPAVRHGLSDISRAAPDSAG
ncbi:MAG: STAS domain-containing protein [Planctomycetes bacterium]|nr:STAS domain-containing protein [Planctomycetota bacterium]